MRIVSMAAALLLAACGGPPVTINADVSDADLAPYRQAGTSVVFGQGFLRQQGGGVVTCAGEQVLLMPDLPPIRQAIEAYRHGSQVTMTGRSWDNTARKTTCDAQGNFRFEGLPVANWYVGTEVRWQVGYAVQGGSLGSPVATRQGETTQVLLTDANFIAR